MSLKELTKNFTYAVERLRVCENNLAAAIRRRDELSGRETEMRLELASLDRATEMLSDPGKSIADSLAESASLAQRRVGVVAMLDQLERIGDRAGVDTARAKLDIVAAEVDIVDTQREFFESSLREQIEEFWTKNRQALQRMLTTAYAISVVNSAPRSEILQLPGSYVHRLEDLLDSVLSPALIARSDADDTFAVQLDADRGMPAPVLVQSESIANEERRRIVSRLLARLPTEAIVDHILKADIGAPAAAPPDIDRSRAIELLQAASAREIDLAGKLDEARRDSTDDEARRARVGELETRLCDVRATISRLKLSIDAAP